MCRKNKKSKKFIMFVYHSHRARSVFNSFTNLLNEIIKINFKKVSFLRNQFF
jgi:hypothetical protein